MDYSHHMMFGLLGVVPALAIFHLLRAQRRAWIPPLGWWLSLALGIVVLFYGMSHSTTPSFSTRITIVGRAYDYVEREIHTGYHHNTIYGFQLVPEEGQPIHIETEISLLDSAKPTIFNGRTLRVVYLAERRRVLNNEAVEIEILSGEHAGYHESVDARLLGAWLGIPLGAALLAFGGLGLKCMESDAIAAASDDNEDLK